MPIKRSISMVEIKTSYSIADLQTDINNFLTGQPDILINDILFSTVQHPEETPLFSVLIYYKINS